VSTITAIDRAAAARAESRAEPEPAPREPTGAAARWLLWSPVLALVVGAVVVPGGLALFLLPLLGLGYGVFALIAWLGPSEE
jgi:hypothetical protein